MITFWIFKTNSNLLQPALFFILNGDGGIGVCSKYRIWYISQKKLFNNLKYWESPELDDIVLRLENKYSLWVKYKHV